MGIREQQDRGAIAYKTPPDPSAKIARRLFQRRERGVAVKDRLIYAYGSVDTQLCWELTTALHEFNAADRGKKQVEPIRILLNSDGGDDYIGWACVDAILASEAPVHILGTGQVMSMATAIFMAGDRRELTQNCRMMVHDGALVNETRSVHSSVAIALGKEQEVNGVRYANFIATRATQKPLVKLDPLNEDEPQLYTLDFDSKKRVEVLCRQETFLSPAEAIGLGFAHAVLDPTEYKEWLR